MTPREQAHLRIHQLVADAPGISQRQLAERLGISLGKTDYLINTGKFPRQGE
jgi:predicted DNA-binding transcriptional regulator AlpA